MAGRVRRRALLRLCPLALAAACARPASGDAGLSALETAAVPVAMCRKVLRPVARYIEAGEWDRGRTNVNYCTRVLALPKRIKEAAEFLDDAGYFTAMDAAGELDNLLSQLDASLYTPLFIPSDEGISLPQRKYQDQAREFYAASIAYLDAVLDVLPAESAEKARRAADASKYQIRIEPQ